MKAHETIFFLWQENGVPGARLLPPLREARGPCAGPTEGTASSHGSFGLGPFSLVWQNGSAHWKCSCRFFQRKRICCRHIFSVTNEKPCKEHADVRCWKIFDDKFGRSKAITKSLQAFVDAKMPGVPAGTRQRVEKLLCDNEPRWAEHCNMDDLQWLLDTDGTACLSPDSYWCNPENPYLRTCQRIVSLHGGSASESSSSMREHMEFGMEDELHPAPDDQSSHSDSEGGEKQ